jgi:hypothetical protein
MWPFRKKKSANQVNIEIHMREHEKFSKWLADKKHEAEVEKVTAQLTKTWDSILLVRPELAKEEETIFNMAHLFNGDLYKTVAEWDRNHAEKWASQFIDLRTEPVHPTIHHIFGMPVWIDPAMPPGVAIIRDGTWHLRPERFGMDTLYKWRAAWLLSNRPQTYKVPYISKDPLDEHEAKLWDEFCHKCENADPPHSPTGLMAVPMWKEYYYPVLEKKRMGMGKVQKQLEELQTAIAEERRVHADEVLTLQLQAQDWKNKCEQQTMQLALQGQTIWDSEEEIRQAQTRGFNRGAEWQKRRMQEAAQTEHGFEVPAEYLTTLEAAQTRARRAETMLARAQRDLVVEQQKYRSACVARNSSDARAERLYQRIKKMEDVVVAAFNEVSEISVGRQDKFEPTDGMSEG